MAVTEEAEGVVAEIAHRESEIAELGVLAHMDKLVRHQFAITDAVAVVLEEDPASDCHAGGAAWQHGDGDDADPLREIGIDHVIRRELRTFQVTHNCYVRAVLEWRSR